jgi:hypothetical protein
MGDRTDDKKRGGGGGKNMVIRSQRHARDKQKL